jgi:hypothetical protein
VGADASDRVQFEHFDRERIADRTFLIFLGVLGEVELREPMTRYRPDLSAAPWRKSDCCLDYWQCHVCAADEHA